VQSQAKGADSHPLALTKAIALVLVAGFKPNAVAIHPNDWVESDNAGWLDAALGVHAARSWRSTWWPRPHLHRNVSRTRQTPVVVMRSTASRRPRSALPQREHSLEWSTGFHCAAAVLPP